jgi:hypothetical protein
MTDEFLTRGLESDRYLKAIRLIGQFENEIEAVLAEFGDRMVDQHADLFERGISPDVRTRQSPSSLLAFHRLNFPMKGPQAPETGQTLNVHLYWVPPTEYNRTDIDGALRAFGYKIKGADQDIDEQVVERTRGDNWEIATAGNPFDDNITFYRHVSSMAEIEATADTLVDHFAAFGDEYAATPGER